ncbi:MAG TPA: zinc-binding protein [Thermoplasmata archaeon]|jgi:uncharacterized metal-binding protein|nr:MAG TPA: zinc-binding protein [Thermoplasmata archaeon]
MKKDKCLCETDEVLIFPCSGGSNVGQIANETAKKLSSQGIGGMSCLAGIGGHISGFAEATRAVKKIVAVDGCPVHCARKTLEHAECPVTIHLVVTELGIRKTSDFHLEDKDIVKVENAVKEKLKK